MERSRKRPAETDAEAEADAEQEQTFTAKDTVKDTVKDIVMDTAKDTVKDTAKDVAVHIDTSKTTAATKKNTAVFVSGLPDDTLLDELVEYFSKYGLIMDDMFTGGPRIKMYEDAASGDFKGEALVVYLREESARMAVEYLDESYFRADCLIRVQMASFSPEDATEGRRGLHDEGRNGKLAVDKRQWKAHMQKMNQKLAWTANDYASPEEEAAFLADLKRQEKYKRIVVLRNMFTREQYEGDLTFALDLKTDVQEECDRLGTITAIHVLPDELAVTIKFRETEAAMACIKLMHGRYFDGRRLCATTYDGSFSLKERKQGANEEETRERLEEFANWLEQDHDKEEDEDREDEGD